MSSSIKRKEFEIKDEKFLILGGKIGNSGQQVFAIAIRLDSKKGPIVVKNISMRLNSEDRLVLTGKSIRKMEKSDILWSLVLRQRLIRKLEGMKLDDFE